MSGAPAELVKVWDLPTRAVHWAIVGLFVISWSSAELDWHLVHRVSGYTMLTVVLFRVYWGFVGSDSARFGRFLRGPSAVLAYVDTLFQRDQAPSEGHNPLGGWAAALLLGLLLTQCAIGLVALPVSGTDGGPLSGYLSFDSAREMALIHGRMFNVALLVVIVHVCAVGFYWFVKRQNLLLPMITGYRTAANDGTRSSLRFVPAGRPAVAIAVLALVVTVLVLEFRP